LIFFENKVEFFLENRFNFVSNLTLLATDQQYIWSAGKHLHHICIDYVY